MSQRRITRFPYLLLWAALVVVQFIAVREAAEHSKLLATAALLFMQGVKAVVAGWRLNDLGRPADDAILSFIPLVNIGLWWQLLKATPPKQMWQKRRDQWNGQLTARQVLTTGATLLPAALPMAIILATAYACVSALGMEAMLVLFEEVRAMAPSSRATLSQTLWLIAGVLGLYTLLQFRSRERKTRVSWMPSLFFVPMALFALGVQLIETQTGPLILGALFGGWNLIWASIGGASVAIGWILFAQAKLKNETPSLPNLLSEVARRTPDVAVVHGAKVHAVTIGMQVIIPGIHYALQLAFVNAIAVLEPNQPALKRSAELTGGIRRRIFKVLFLGLVLALSFQIGFAWWLDGLQALQGALFDPTALSTTTNLLSEFTAIMVWGIVEIGLLQMYLERQELRAQKATA